MAAKKDCIRLTYDKKTYELAFNRETVKQTERMGFDIKAMMDARQPGTQSELLFQGAFLARHRNDVKVKNITEIYEHLDHKTDLLAALVELYAATLETLTDTAAVVEDGKNVTWEVV